METTKSKLDVKALVARANEKAKAVNESVEKVQAIKETFRMIPGFSKYEFNGNIVRNAKTKNIISFKTGRTKYQLTNDSDESKNLSKDEIKALFPAEKIVDMQDPSSVKATIFYKKRDLEESGPIEKKTVSKIIKERKKKEAKPKKEKVIKEKVVVENVSVKDLTKEDIMKMDSKMNKKIYLLHLKGCSNKEIHELTKSPMPTISRDIWRFKKGITTL